MKNNILLILLLLFTMISCEKFETPSVGENSFYCEINGTPYHPEKYGGLEGLDRPLYIKYYSHSEKLIILTYDIDTKYSIDINLEYFKGENEYSFYNHFEYSDPNLNNYIKISKGIIVNGELQLTTYVTSDNPLKAHLEIVEFDGSSKFVGVFDAVLYNISNGLDTLNITNGRFDINTETLN